MIKGESIICVSNTTWYGKYTKSTVQLMSLLAEYNDVFFIEYPFTVKDIFTTVIGKQSAPILRMLGIKKRLKQIKVNGSSVVHHYVMPPVLPINFIKNKKVFNFLYRLNTRYYRNRVLKGLKVENPIVVNAYNPFYGLPLLGKLKEKLSVYYCYDGTDVNRYGKRILPIEEAFSKSVDVIITTSDHLKESRIAHNKKTYVVKNGVDFELFSPFRKKTVSKKNTPKKIGYIGSLDERFDIDCVEHAVRQLPDFIFEFTGDLRNQTIKERLNNYENVIFFPAIAPDEVPALLATYDLGIIPYIANEINKNIYPLKINEFLAVGIPVVMTDFAILPEFGRFVQTAESKEKFTTLIASEIDLDTDQKIEERVVFARSNSWKERARSFAEILSKYS